MQITGGSNSQSPKRNNDSLNNLIDFKNEAEFTAETKYT